MPKKESLNKTFDFLIGYKKMAFIVIAVIAAVCLLFGFLHSFNFSPLDRLTKEWSENERLNKRIFMEEPAPGTDSQEHVFMGSIEITYDFIKNAPSWTNGEPETIQVSYYETKILREVKLYDKEEKEAFAQYQLRLKYDEMKRKGYIDKMPSSKDYTFEMVIPMQNETNLAAFYKEPSASSELLYEISYSYEGGEIVGYLPLPNDMVPVRAKLSEEILKEAADLIREGAQANSILLPVDFEEEIRITLYRK